MTARLISSRELAPEVREFLFEAIGVDRLDFKPGQFVSFTSDYLGKPVTRAYSLASAPDGNQFELCLNRVQEGRLSPILFDMAPGDVIEMKGPFGYFVPRKPLRDSVWIATGTGIAPFRSFLLSPDVTSSDIEITLLFGARYEGGLLYRDLFERRSQAGSSFQFIPTITRPSPNWKGRVGRVQDHLDEALAGRTEIDIYVCGLKAMVNEVRDLLKERGFDRTQIILEKYD